MLTYKVYSMPYASLYTHKIYTTDLFPGLLYLALKHIVDRYNLYFAYKPSRISPGIHSSAVTYTVWAAIMLQLNILFFAVVRKTGELKPYKRHSKPDLTYNLNYCLSFFINSERKPSKRIQARTYPNSTLVKARKPI